jgi:hypothetical protein
MIGAHCCRAKLWIVIDELAILDGSANQLGPKSASLFARDWAKTGFTGAIAQQNWCVAASKSEAREKFFFYICGRGFVVE